MKVLCKDWLVRAGFVADEKDLKIFSNVSKDSIYIKELLSKEVDETALEILKHIEEKAKMFNRVTFNTWRFYDDRERIWLQGYANGIYLFVVGLGLCKCDQEYFIQYE